MEKNGLFGLFNFETGEAVIEPQYITINYLSEGLASFEKKTKWKIVEVSEHVSRFNFDAEDGKDISIWGFLNEKGEISDAKGYHKSLFTAMNADQVAQHFYEQGKADAMKDSMARTKNVDMKPRGVHEEVTISNGWKVRAVDSGVNTSGLKVKFRNK